MAGRVRTRARQEGVSGASRQCGAASGAGGAEELRRWGKKKKRRKKGADMWARRRSERGRRAGVSGPEEGSAARALGLSGEAVWADRGKEKRGELGPGREREEWAAERVGPRV